MVIELSLLPVKHTILLWLLVSEGAHTPMLCVPPCGFLGDGICEVCTTSELSLWCVLSFSNTCRAIPNRWRWLDISIRALSINIKVMHILSRLACAGFTVTLPCVGPGTTRVFANLTSSGFIGGTLYTNSYVFEFYRSCKANTSRS